MASSCLVHKRIDSIARRPSGGQLAIRVQAVGATLNIEVQLLLTAHSDYALQAFEVRGVDYLIKPVRPERFDEAVERIREGQPGNGDVYVQGPSSKLPMRRGREEHPAGLIDPLQLDNLVDCATIWEGGAGAHSLPSLPCSSPVAKAWLNIAPHDDPLDTYRR